MTDSPEAHPEPSALIRAAEAWANSLPSDPSKLREGDELTVFAGGQERRVIVTKITTGEDGAVTVAFAPVVPTVEVAP
jgi:hypothetical protein